MRGEKNVFSWPGACKYRQFLWWWQISLLKKRACMVRSFAQWSPWVNHDWNTNFGRWCQLYAIRGSNLCRGISNGTLKQIAVLIVASVSWNFNSRLWMKRTKCRFVWWKVVPHFHFALLTATWQIISSKFYGENNSVLPISKLALARSILAWVDKRPRQRGYSISSDQCKSYMLRLTWNFDVTWLYSFQCLLPLTITDKLILIWY